MKRIPPFTVKKMAAASGLANSVRNVCSSASPMMPAGIVAMMMSQAIRSWTVSTLRWRIELKKPPMIRTQSRQKNSSNASAVATCSPTINAR